MCLKVIQTLISYVIVYVIAFEDVFYVYGQASQEILNQGRMQYQLLQERGSLPQYGNCWKSAVEHIDEGCRSLSEETQSDMALHLTNCFLEMSGHETYNCELDKKPNLKAICVRSMTDRAFNVYTEFYTHTQNICWFLRGQVWHETIAENTLRVGKQLHSSAQNQAKILEGQRESLALQEKLLHYGQNLEKIMEDFYISTRQHQEILSVMSKSLSGLQAWLVGELSWFDLVVYYVAAAVLIGIFTSISRTASARLPILFLLAVNAVVERLICAGFVLDGAENEIHLVQNEIYRYIWWSRKMFIVLAVCILIYQAFSYQDLMRLNNGLLRRIYDQNMSILEKFHNSNDHSFSNGSINFTDERSTIGKSFNELKSLNLNGSNSAHLDTSNSAHLDSSNSAYLNGSNSTHLNGTYKTNNYIERKEETYKERMHTNGVDHSSYDKKDINIFRNKLNVSRTRSDMSKEKVPFNKLISARQRLTPFTEFTNNGRYNLRSSRQGTPESNI